MANLSEETSRFKKEVFLVVLGVLLGALIGWFSGWAKDAMDQRSEQRDAASVLLAFVESESQMNKSLIKTMSAELQGEQSVIPITSPEGLKWQHDPNVPRALFERVGKLQPDVVIKYLGYLQMREQCASFRDLLLNRMIVDQGGHRVDAWILKAYLTSLEGFENSAGELRGLIERYYGPDVPPRH